MWLKNNYIKKILFSNDWVSLLDDISTYECNLVPKPILLKDSNDTI